MTSLAQVITSEKGEPACFNADSTILDQQRFTISELAAERHLGW